MRLVESTLEAYLEAPVGHYVTTPRVVLWAASPTLCGGLAWDTPDESDARFVTRVFRHHEVLASGFSIVIDSRRMEGFTPGALAMLMAFLAESREALASRIRLQASLIERGAVGFIAAGMIPALASGHPNEIFTDPAEAYRAAGGDAAVSLVDELEAIVLRVRGVAPEIAALRTLLGGRLEITLEQAALEIGSSTRSLQRVLSRNGSSFTEEVTRARLELAQQLLRASDDKLALIAARVGISERALTSLFRSRTALSPAEWRKQQRA